METHHERTKKKKVGKGSFLGDRKNVDTTDFSFKNYCEIEIWYLHVGIMLLSVLTNNLRMLLPIVNLRMT